MASGFNRQNGHGRLSAAACFPWKKAAVALISSAIAVSLASPAYTGAFFTDEKPLTAATFKIEIPATKLCAYMAVCYSVCDQFQLKVMLPSQQGLNAKEIKNFKDAVIAIKGLTINGQAVETAENDWRVYNERFLGKCLAGDIHIIPAGSGAHWFWPFWSLTGLYELQLTINGRDYVLQGIVWNVMPGFNYFPEMPFDGKTAQGRNSSEIGEDGADAQITLPEPVIPDWDLPEWDIPAWDYEGWYFPDIDEAGELPSPSPSDTASPSGEESPGSDADVTASGEASPSAAVSPETPSPETDSPSPPPEASPEQSPEPEATATSSPEPEPSPEPEQKTDPQPEPAPPPDAASEPGAEAGM